MLKTVVLLNIFVETMIIFPELFEMEIVFKIKNAFTVTFDQYKSSMLN